jgi:hypothetical protein
MQKRSSFVPNLPNCSIQLLKHIGVPVALFALLLFGPLVFVVRAQSIESPSTLCETGCLLSPTGLIGWWTGDGTATDIQLGNNGVLMNGAAFAPGLVKQAFSLDGDDDFVDVADTPALHAIATAVTIDAWINPRTLSFGEGFVFARRDPLISEGISLFINNDGYLRTQMQTGSVDFSEADSAAPVIRFNGQWQHIAVTADTATGQVALYLNGMAIPIMAIGSIGGHFASVSHLFIGRRQGLDTPEGAQGALHYKGLIDEVELYNRALSAAEVRAIYRVGRRGKCKPHLQTQPDSLSER